MIYRYATCVIFLIAANAIAAGDGNSNGIGREQTLEEYTKLSIFQGESRKIQIKPIVPAVGIPTGVVLAYGHIIPAPFVVKQHDKKLLINEVQVEPSIVREEFRRRVPRKERKISSKKKELRKELGEVYLSAKENYAAGLKNSNTDIRAEILTMMNSHPNVIRSPKWDSDDTVCFLDLAHAVKSPAKTCWRFGASTFLMDPLEIAQREYESRKNDIRNIEAALREGKIVIFRSEDGGALFRDDCRRQVAEVMNSNLSRRERITALKKIFGTFEVALDVVDNYVATEWNVPQK